MRPAVVDNTDAAHACQQYTGSIVDHTRIPSVLLSIYPKMAYIIVRTSPLERNGNDDKGPG